METSGRQGWEIMTGESYTQGALCSSNGDVLACRLDRVFGFEFRLL
jgi:hypothetical protein